MSTKRFTAIVVAAATATTIGVHALTPHDSSPAQRQQQEVTDLAHNEEKVHSQLNDEGRELQDADNFDRLRPVEPRPLDPKLRLRIPLP